jgi:MFS transporter, DHA2 family, multidrug resistance protein
VTVPRPSNRKAWVGLAVLALPTLLVSMDMSVLYLAMPVLSADLQPSGTELLWIADIYGFVLGGALIPMGVLADRIGRRRILLIGGAAFGLASLAAAFSTNAPMLIAARAALGVAGATLLPSTLALIRNMFPDPREHSSAIGIWTTCFTLGGVAGPLIGGLLLDYFWWGSVFLIGVPVMLLLLIAGPMLLPEHRDPISRRIDLASVGMAFVAMLASVFGFKQLAADGMSAGAVVVLLAGLLLGYLFVRRQGALANPLVDLALFRQPAFSVALGTNTLALFAWMGASLLAAQYLQLVVGMTPFNAGLWTLPAAFASIVGCLASPLLAHRLSPGLLVSAASAITAAGLAMIAGVEIGGMPVVVAGMTLVGLGVASVVTLGTDVIVRAAPADRAGAAAALSESGAEIGGALGVAVLGSVATAVYRGMLEVAPGLSPEAKIGSYDTLGGAAALARQLPFSEGEALLAVARAAFSHGLALAAGVGAVVLLVAAIVAWKTLRMRSPAEANSYAGAS